MTRFAVLGLVLVAACDPARRGPVDAASDAVANAPLDAPGEPWVPPPPTVDAGAPPMVSCTDAGFCEPPHSTCLDASYIVYYTDGACSDGACSFTTNLLYCPDGCINGGCQGGFT